MLQIFLKIIVGFARPVTPKIARLNAVRGGLVPGAPHNPSSRLGLFAPLSNTMGAQSFALLWRRVGDRRQRIDFSVEAPCFSMVNRAHTLPRALAAVAFRLLETSLPLPVN